MDLKNSGKNLAGVTKVACRSICQKFGENIPRPVALRKGNYHEIALIHDFVEYPAEDALHCRKL
jgi:hypothetical protein